MPVENTAAGRLLDDVGVARPEAQQVEVPDELPFISFSPELLTEHDAHVALPMAGGGVYDAMTALPLDAELTGSTATAEDEFWTSSHPFAVSWRARVVSQSPGSY